MEIPTGFVGMLWSFISFLPFFSLFLTLGILKAALIGPVAVGIIGVGNSAVIIGLWPAHCIWTYYCVARSKKLGLALKIVVLLSLSLPLVLWPVLGIVGSLLGGVGYGFFTPLIATFEASGENFWDKFYHCFADGCWSTIRGSCTVVQDFTDFCFHSYFSYMDELNEKIHVDEKPMDIKLTILPSCLLACLIGVPVDVLLITSVALWKSPYMLFRGWKRLLEDLIGREGPFLETACVPFAGLAIILWPLAVIGAVIGASVSSFFLGLYSGIVVHQFLLVLVPSFYFLKDINFQEDSLLMGLYYIVAVISLFDEYVNDLLYLREGSCLPRPIYRRKMSSSLTTKMLDDNDLKNRRQDSLGSKLVSQQSRTLKWAVQQYKPIQVWDWLFKSCKVNGRILIHNGIIDLKDFEECILKGDCKKLSIKLPALSILQCLLTSAKSNSSGLVISDDVDLTRTNGPKEKVFEWFIGPLLIMKEQLKALQLDENEENCLVELFMKCKNDRAEDWDGTEFSSSDKVRRAQLQAIIRRLQGLVTTLSRMPTFRRRFKNLVKLLYLEAVRSKASGNHIGEIVASKNGSENSGQNVDKEIRDETVNTTEYDTSNKEDEV